MRILIISDPHFNHENIIRYSNRPYQSTLEMDEAIIANWNRVVGEDDMVICLGDFCFGVQENISYYASRLNGRKVLIRGNHDRKASLYLEAGFSDVKSELYMPAEIIGSKQTILLTHKPRLGLPLDLFNIHGHIHDCGLDPELFNLNQHFNASVENINYTPIELQKIIKRMGW